MVYLFFIITFGAHTKQLIMLQIILQLLLAMGIYFGPRSTSEITVIDQTTGQVYGIGVANGGGTSVTTRDPNVFYLVKDENGTYRLVRAK